MGEFCQLIDLLSCFSIGLSLYLLLDLVATPSLLSDLMEQKSLKSVCVCVYVSLSLLPAYLSVCHWLSVVSLSCFHCDDTLHRSLLSIGAYVAYLLMSISPHYGQQTSIIMWRQGSCSWPRLHPTAPYA